MTTLDPHDFNQPSLKWPILEGFADFLEPKVQVWENITFADNYYQTTPALTSPLTFTPAGRPLPELPATEAGKTAAGLQLPRVGWPLPPDSESAPLLGQPDVNVLLGTRDPGLGSRFFQPEELEVYRRNRIGFNFDEGRAEVHGRVVSWYTGTTELGSIEFAPTELFPDYIHRRRGDGLKFHFTDGYKPPSLNIRAAVPTHSLREKLATA